VYGVFESTVVYGQLIAQHQNQGRLLHTSLLFLAVAVLNPAKGAAAAGRRHKQRRKYGLPRAAAVSILDTLGGAWCSELTL
jgi:hypothetical protein